MMRTEPIAAAKVLRAAGGVCQGCGNHRRKGLVAIPWGGKLAALCFRCWP